MVNQRHRLESSADEIHRLESRVDQRHRLESGAKISNTHNVTRQVKGVPQGADCCVHRSNLCKHPLSGIRNSENPERAIPRAKIMSMELAEHNVGQRKSCVRGRHRSKIEGLPERMAGIDKSTK